MIKSNKCLTLFFECVREFFTVNKNIEMTENLKHTIINEYCRILYSFYFNPKFMFLVKVGPYVGYQCPSLSVQLNWKEVCGKLIILRNYNYNIIIISISSLKLLEWIHTKQWNLTLEDWKLSLFFQKWLNFHSFRVRVHSK